MRSKEAPPHRLKDELYARLRLEPDLFDFLQEGSLDGIWYWDLEHPEEEWMSPRFWEVLGYDPAEKQHRMEEWHCLVEPSDLEKALESYHRHLADPSHPYDQVVRYRHRDGSTVWIRCRGVVIRDADGTPRRMLGAHTDLTPLKRVEAALEQRTRELEEANRRLQEALLSSLGGILPVCGKCHAIRDATGRWHALATYLSQHSRARLSHGLCPDCLRQHYGEFADEPNRI